MAISFKCAGCGKQYSVGSQLGGKKAQCKNCGVVMKIPAMAPSHEPDLNLDGAEPRAGSGETVAGSLIQGTLDTVAGRSVSGQSLSGRSAAGNSVSGRSASGRSAQGRSVEPPPAYEPPPMDDGPSELDALGRAPSELEALKHVARSEHDAFDVHGGTDQPLRNGRGPARANRAPPEIVSMLLIAGLIGSLGYAAFMKLQAATNGLPADVIAEAGKPLVPVVVQNAVVFALTAAVAAPLVLAGWLGACKILNFRTPDGLYMRSFGLASLPVAAFVLAYAFGLGATAPMLALATALLGYVVLQFVHAQKPVLAGTAAGLATLGGLIGVAVAVMVADTVSQGMTRDYQTKLATANAKVQQKKLAANNSKPAAGWNTGTASNSAEADAAVKNSRGLLDALKARLSTSQQTREAVDGDVKAAADTLAEGKKTYADRPEWETMAAELQTYQSSVAALPSAKPPADLVEAPPAGTEWGVRAGRREASAFAFNFTPPPEAMLDLDSAAVGEGAPVTWSMPSSSAKLTIESVKSVSDQQKRPWVAPAYVLAAARDAPVGVALDGKPTIEYGTINGVPAAKIAAAEADTGKIVTVYTLHSGDTWLRATIGPAAPNDGGIDLAEQAVRSLRLRSPGEPAADPLPAADLVARFNADPKSADKVAALLRGKPGAEEAVLKGIGFAPDDATLKKYGPLLAAAATGDKGARFLWKLADDDDDVAKTSRDALRRIQPKSADDVAFALLDIKSSKSARIRDGLNALGTTEVDKARQPAVTRTLSASFDQLAGGTYGEKLEGVLGKWLDDDLGRRVQQVLDTSTSGQAERRMAMRVLAATGKQKYVPSICRWFVEDGSAAVDTLVQMGPVVEKDVINTLIDRGFINPKGRLAAISVLNEVGSMRSVTTLQKMTSAGDPEVRDAAKSAIIHIREKGATPPADQPK